MLTTPDSFSDAHIRRIVAWFALDLAVTSLRDREFIVCVPGEKPRRALQPDLVNELHADGLPQLARRVERMPIPRGCVGVFGIGADVRLFVTRVDEPNRSGDDDGDESDDAVIARRASAVGVLGVLGGSR